MADFPVTKYDLITKIMSIYIILCQFQRYCQSGDFYNDAGQALRRDGPFFWSRRENAWSTRPGLALGKWETLTQSGALPTKSPTSTHSRSWNQILDAFRYQSSTPFGVAPWQTWREYTGLFLPYVHCVSLFLLL